MNHSSTQVPFMIAAFIAVIIYSVTSEPEKDNRVKAVNAVPQSAQVVVLAPLSGEKVQKVASR